MDPRDRYRNNARWLMCLAPCKALAVSAAYVTPFFLEKGLSLSEIFLLQSWFSLWYVLLEIPGGRFADRFGRAFSIRLSAPLAAAAMIAYGFSDTYVLFLACELLLAVANSLISGVDTALLIDSLKASGRERDYVRVAQRIDALGYAAVALAVPLAFVLVRYIGISATLIADGVLIGVGAMFAWKLVEAPRDDGSQEEARISARHSARVLLRNPEARWLVAFGMVLSTSTYLGFWLSAPYYTELGIPLALFGAALAGRSLFKAWLAHRFHAQRRLGRNMAVYAALPGLVFLAMASGQLWLMWAVLGHDIVQALHRQPVTRLLNRHIHLHRATMNSVVSLVQRLCYTVVGPLIGLVVDTAGLTAGLTVLGLVSSAAAFYSLIRLNRLGAFSEGR